MSLRHQQYFLDLPADDDDTAALEETVKKSLADQRALEDADDISFDEFLQNYFAQQA
jgi:hypothetical protein